MEKNNYRTDVWVDDYYGYLYSIYGNTIDYMSEGQIIVGDKIIYVWWDCDVKRYHIIIRTIGR